LFKIDLLPLQDHDWKGSATYAAESLEFTMTSASEETLPVPSLPVVEDPIPRQGAKNTFRVLIMDTVKHVNLLKYACKAAGHAVVPAHNIKEAFAFLETEDHADVIICAAYLEDESMFEFLKRLRSVPHHEKTKFAILALAPGVSGTRTNSSTEKAAFLLGANAFINMPEFDAAQLIAEIHNLLPAVPALEADKKIAAGMSDDALAG
jgi:CheY-like chemotaxis protein